MIIRNESISQRQNCTYWIANSILFFFFPEIGQTVVLKRIQYHIIKEVSDFAQKFDHDL